MSSDTVWNADDLGNDSDSNNTVKTLRERGDAAVAKAKELEKQLRERDQQLRSLQLAAKGVDEKVAKLIPADVTDVDAWLEEYGDLFTKTKAETPDKPEDKPDQQQANVDSGDQDAMQDIANTMGGAGAPARVDDVLARLQADDLTFEELEKIRLSGGRLS